MANELKVLTQMTLANGDLDSFTKSSRTQNITQNTAAPFRVDGTQDVGTAAAGETLDITGLTTLGWAYFRNRHATRFVEIGVQVTGTFYALVRLDGNENCVFRLAQGITPYVRADTGSVILERMIIDD